MSQTVRLITPTPNHLGIYSRIWNTQRDDMRQNQTNLCRGCTHQIMLFNKDYKKIVSKTGTKHKRVYYHGEPCHICGKICGDVLLNGDSRGISK